MTDRQIDPRSAPSGVADLVDYQTDAIVSRIVLKTPTGSITVFAFDAGQSVSEHRVPHSVLVHALDGEVEMTVDGVAHRMRPGPRRGDRPRRKRGRRGHRGREGHHRQRDVGFRPR